MSQRVNNSGTEITKLDDLSPVPVTASAGTARTVRVVTADRPAMRSVMVVVGTRPEGVKLAPLVHALGGSASCRPVLVSTGQHREMLDQVLTFFGLTPDLDLGLLVPGQGLAELTARAVTALSGAITAVEPDLVVVQGDTTSTFAGALAAYYAGVPVAHVEAGLRTGNLRAPHPEEANRRLTGVLTDLHLAATTGARDNLLGEGTDPSRIVVTGNTVIDALHWAVERRAGYGSDEIEALDASGRPIVLVTAHRRESWGAPMEAVGRALGELARRHPGVAFVFPIHRNPTVRSAIAPGIAGRDNVLLTEPLEYGAFSRLMARSSLILTDSGGVQEEAPALGKPVLVLRETTERPEAVAAGCAVLVGTDEERIVAEASALLADPVELARRSVMESPFGDGRAAARCRDAIEALLAAR